MVARGALVAVAALSWSPAYAQEDEEKPVVPRDRSSHARTGEARLLLEPLPAVARACAARAGVCVAAERAGALSEGRLQEALLAAEEAAGAYRALGLPGPLAPLEGPFTVVLVDRDVPIAEAIRPLRRRVYAPIDAVEAQGVADGRAGGCALAVSVARAVAAAIGARTSPAEDRGTRDGVVASLTHLAVPCAAGFDGPAVAAFQAHPERAVVAVARPELSDALPVAESPGAGTSLFFDWLDGTLGARPGAALVGIWAAGATRTAAGAPRWQNEPDAFDLLAVSGKGAFATGSDLGDLFLQFATDRLFLPVTRSPWAGGYRPWTRAPLDREIPWPAAPRRFLHVRPIAATGVTTLAVDLAGRPAGKRLRAEITWEDFAHFRFRWVTLDGAGRPIGAYAMPAEARGTQANGTLIPLDGAAKVVLLGAADGDPRYPFDPDDAVWEPHGYDLVIAAVD